MTLLTTAHTALAAYGITNARLRALNNGFNTTYRVTIADGTRYALRLGTNSLRDEASLTAELQWIQALADTTDIPVAQLYRTTTNAPFLRIYDASINKHIYAVLSHWVPGRIVGERPTRSQLLAMGRVIAQLHAHASEWKIPTGAQFPTLTHILMNSPDLITSSTNPCLTPALRDGIARVIDRIMPYYKQLAETHPVIPIHADLHGYNVLWHAQKLAVIDFDDAGLGWPIQDIAVCAYHLRTLPGAEDVVRRGYQQIRPFPECDPAAFEAQLIARGILLLNDVIGSPIAADADFAPTYAARLQRRIDAYLETGVFQMLM